MKISVITMLRFHLFNLVEELSKFDNEISLHTAWRSEDARKRFMFEKIKINGHWFFGGMIYINQNFIHRQIKSSILKVINYIFSKYSVRQIPVNTDKIILCTTHYYPIIKTLKKYKAEIIIDHGSLHPRFEKKIMDKENKEYGFSSTGNEYNHWIGDWIEKECRYADKIFVCSNLAKKTFIDQGVEKNKVFVNKLGVRIDEFSLGMKSYEIDKNDVNIIIVGAVTPKKGIHRLIEALELLEKYNFRIKCAGALPEDTNLKNILNKKRKNINIDLIGKVPQSQLKTYYQAADLFILPSLFDGFGMVTTQALASGTIAAVSQSAGSSELIIDEKNGFIIPDITDPEASSEIIEKIICLPVLKRKKIAEHARHTMKVLDGWGNYGKCVNKNLMNNV